MPSLNAAEILAPLFKEISDATVPTHSLECAVELKTHLKASKQLVKAGLVKEIPLVKQIVADKMQGWPPSWVEAAQSHAIGLLFEKWLGRKTQAKLVFPWIVGIDIFLALDIAPKSDT